MEEVMTFYLNVSCRNCYKISGSPSMLNLVSVRYRYQYISLLMWLFGELFEENLSVYHHNCLVFQVLTFLFEVSKELNKDLTEDQEDLSQEKLDENLHISLLRDWLIKSKYPYSIQNE